VHNVAFKKPPIGKRGYDEEEVDAFLDIVEVELSRLIEENNDLRARFGSGAPADGASTDSGHDEALRTQLAGVQDENRRLQSHVGELEKTLSQGKNGAQQQVVQLQQQLAQTEAQLTESRQALEQARQALHEAQAAAQSAPAQGGDAPAAPADQHVQAVQILAMAQQTADQHLSQSKAEAERLLAEAQANSDSTLAEAKSRSEQHVGEAESRAQKLDDESTSRAARTIQEAEQRAATITAQFEQRKAALERRVEELRTFEREYRTRLKSYLESQLRDLDASGKAEPAPAQSGEYADAPQG
jgi:DivIVA domain-containing protein